MAWPATAGKPPSSNPATAALISSADRAVRTARNRSMAQNSIGMVAATVACDSQPDQATKNPDVQYSRPASAPAAHVVPNRRSHSIMPASAIASCTSFATPIAHQVGVRSIHTALGVRVGMFGALSSAAPEPLSDDHHGMSPDHNLR